MGRMENGQNETTRLLERWYQGDDAALTALLQRHLPTIRAMVRKRTSAYLRKREETGDYVQEAVLKFLRAGPSVRIESEKSLCAFLARVVENMLRDRYDYYIAPRRGRSRPITLYTQAGTTDTTPSEIVGEEEEHHLVRAAMEFLQPADREIVFLHRWEKKTYVEAGAVLGISPDTAAKRFSRAMTRLSGVVRRLRLGQLDPLLVETAALEAE